VVPGKASRQPASTGRERGDDRRGGVGSAPGVAEPAEEAVRGQLGDAVPADRALLQMLVDCVRRIVVELAQAIRTQGLVGRMRDWMGVHREVSGDGSIDYL